MPAPTKGPRLGGSPAHQRLILRNLSQQLFEHKRVTTTVTRARRVRPYAENLITAAKKGDLNARRKVLGQLSDKSVVHELFTTIASAMEDRPGGYTRITKIGNRKGDNAPMALIELVLEPVTPKAKPAKQSAKHAAAPVDEAPAEETPAEVEADAEATEAVEATETDGESVDAGETTDEAPAKDAK